MECFQKWKEKKHEIWNFTSKTNCITETISLSYCIIATESKRYKTPSKSPYKGIQLILSNNGTFFIDFEPDANSKGMTQTAYGIAI